MKKNKKNSKISKTLFLKKAQTNLLLFLIGTFNILTSQKAKVLAAGILTLVLITGFVILANEQPSLHFWNSPGSDRGNLQEVDFSQNPNFQKNLEKLKNVRNTLTPESIVYEKVRYEDLPIYPSGWVDRVFTEVQRRNALISGPSADPDGDGLTNKQEYLLGSDPTNAYTLCGAKKIEEERCTYTDKENLDRGINPLTGFEIEKNREIVYTKQEKAVIQSIQDSFESASKEGVDFPILYQESLKLDLVSQLQKFSFTLVPDSRNSFTNYVEIRLQILERFLEEDELNDQLGGLLIIYRASKPEELEKLKTKYQGLFDELKYKEIPRSYENSHRALLLLFEKLVNLIQHRQQGLATQTLESADYKAESKNLAVEIVWAYRQLNEELLKISQDF